MPKEEEWIDKQVSKAKKGHPPVTDGVATRMKGLLRGKITERHLPPTELAKIANTLIADMAAPASQRAEVSHED